MFAWFEYNVLVRVVQHYESQIAATSFIGQSPKKTHHGYPLAFLLSRWIKPIQHEVDNHAGNRDVQPDRQRPAGDAPMLVEAFAQGSYKRDDREGRHECGENRVGDEDGEIHSARSSLSSELYRADIVMIDEIGNEKQRRSGKGSEHHCTVSGFVSATNVVVAEEKKDCACSVEERVYER